MSGPIKYYFQPGENLTEEQKESNRLFLEQEEQRKEKENKQRAEREIEKRKIADFMNVNFEPFEDRILVFPDPVEATTKGGLYVPDSSIDKVKPMVGTVVRVGVGKFNVALREVQPIPLTPGEKIYYGNYAGTELKFGDVKYLIMRFADCFGRVV